MSFIYINSILDNPSLVDGIGYRTVLFLQGCDIHCKGCQNESTWNMYDGKKIDVKELAVLLRNKCPNKKLTISGGEPLLQQDSLIDLFEEIKDFDLCLYTGHSYDSVPQAILDYLKYIKVGPFIESLKTTIKPFVGSTNQEFMEVVHNDKTK